MLILNNMTDFEKLPDDWQKAINENIFKQKHKMSLYNFKKKYFTDNFYWVTEDNHIKLQEIALEVGCLLHTGEKKMIKWHKGFNNLGFRTYERNNNVTVFQKEAFLVHSEKATNFNEMLKDYKNKQ